MAGDALLPSPQGRDRTFPDLLELFAAVMLGHLTPDDAVSRMASDARRSAREAITSARAPVGSQEILALRSIYDQMRALGPVPAPEATRKNVVLGRTRGAQAMDALLHLRHRQRAALVMHDVGTLPLNVAASVLGLRSTITHDVIEAGRASIVKRLPRPMNVRHVLRDAAGRLISAEVAAVEWERPSKRPRAVVEALIAPIAQPEPEPSTGLLTPGLLKALEASPADVTHVERPRPVEAAERSPSSRPPARPRWRTRAWLAAACALLAAIAFVPAVARAPQRSAGTVPAETTAVTSRPAMTTHIAAVTVPLRQATVIPGDTLWAIARRTAGDGESWPAIWRLNKHVVMADGGRFTDPDLIRPGWRLRLPPGRS